MNKYQRYREKNREKRRLAAAAWRAANPGYRSPNDAENRRAYYEAHKDECLRRSKEHRQKNKGVYAGYRRTRRARERMVPGEHTEQDIIEIFRLQKGRCAYCRKSLSFDEKHVDHIQPIARGGHNGRSNLQILCEPCNVRKNAIDPVDYARRIGRLI